MNKFKIGDLVKVDNDLMGLISNTEGIITDIEIRFSDNLNQLYKMYHIENKETEFYARELELVQTSEQIAVEKFKEELKANVKDTINIIENSINPTNSEFKRMLRLSRLEAYEEVLKLLE